MKRKILVLALIALVIIQFFHPARNIHAGPFPNDISMKYAESAEVKQVLEKACNDCHSNNTVYPWYSNIQPVAWWLQNHVNEGKRELNFNEFLTYPAKKQDHKLEELMETVKEGEMPLNSYTWVHTNAKLTVEERRLLTDWAANIRKLIIL